MQHSTSQLLCCTLLRQLVVGTDIIIIIIIIIKVCCTVSPTVGKKRVPSVDRRAVISVLLYFHILQYIKVIGKGRRHPYRTVPISSQARTSIKHQEQNQLTTINIDRINNGRRFRLSLETPHLFFITHTHTTPPTRRYSQ